MNQAGLTGTLLGMFLAKNSFGENKSINLIGYSLGAVAAYNCIKILKSFSIKNND
jgi:hypothetical protein